MKKVLTRSLLLVLIFLQLGGGPTIHREDPMKRYEKDGENLIYGAASGAALYLVRKVIGETLGGCDFAIKLRKKLPFMSAIFPPPGWLGWKEEILDILGFATLGAAASSYTAGGVIAQQFQFAFSDTLSHVFISTIAEAIRGDRPFSTQPPIIDVVMVKAASQVIRDALIPGGTPAARGRHVEVLILNAATELTVESFIGAVEGAALAAMYTQLRNKKVSLKDYMLQEIAIGATARGIQTIGKIVFMGPRVHVSKSERRKIKAYAKARGVDISWALKHSQFRDIKYALSRKLATGNKPIAYAHGREVGIPHRFDPRNNEEDRYTAAHEATHVNQMVNTPDWLYLRLRYSDFRKSAGDKEHDDRVFEQFPESLKFRSVD